MGKSREEREGKEGREGQDMMAREEVCWYFKGGEMEENAVVKSRPAQTRTRSRLEVKVLEW